VPGINPHEPVASLAICMRLGETEEITKLPLTREMITRLVFEAQVREMNVAELLAALITAKTKTDSANWVRTAGPGRIKPKTHRVLRSVRRHLCRGDRPT
jgi:hypothetical protein